jgi:hypothetical protein
MRSSLKAEAISWNRAKRSQTFTFEVSRILVRLDHVASFIINANHGIA